MTDEEKAKEYLKEICPICNDREACLADGCNCYIKEAYLDGLAEGRKEKCFEQNKDGTIRPCEVMKENEELKDQLKNNPYVQLLQKEKSEMAEDFAKQIEKMKCCGNCKHSYSVNTGGCYDTKCELTGLDCINCKDKWEPAE